jgi:hypothetical protein
MPRRAESRRAVGLLHVPKAGGTAVRNAVRSIPGTHATTPYFDEDMIAGVSVTGLPEAMRAEFVRDGELRELCSRYQLVVGHFSGRHLLDAGCRRLAVLLREPRARILSLYRYWRALNPTVLSDWGEWGATTVASAQFAFSEFLRSPHVWPATENAISRQILVHATPPNATAAGRATSRALRGSGYRTIRDRLAVVEWSTHSQRFVDRICELVEHQESPEVARENETPAPDGVQPIDTWSRARLEEATRLDRQLMERLMADGHLPPRSPTDLDAEFATTAARLGFELG